MALKVVAATNGEDGGIETDMDQSKFSLEFGVECSWKLIVLSAGINISLSLLSSFFLFLLFHLFTLIIGGGTEPSLPLRGFSGTLTTSWHPEEIQINDSGDVIGNN